MSKTVSDVVAELERMVPLGLAESWDNVGLLMGTWSHSVRRIMTCLTLTEDVATEACDRNVDLILTHHPILFRAIQKLNSTTRDGRIISRLMHQGTAVYCAHTAYDNAPRGINQQLAESLGLTNIQPLVRRAMDEVCKIIVFVPTAALIVVQQAAWSAGAGQIGDYHSCSFYHEGVGTFHGTESTNPAVGQRGQLERVVESRLELICFRSRLKSVLKAIGAAHPYEEPAIDVVPLLPAESNEGVGRIGRFATPISAQALAGQICEWLGLESLEMVGRPDRLITWLAIGCGASDSLLGDVIRTRCDAMLLGEARFHVALEARDHDISLFLVGHYASERPAMENWANELGSLWPDIECFASAAETNPIRTWRQP